MTQLSDFSRTHGVPLRAVRYVLDHQLVPSRHTGQNLNQHGQPRTLTAAGTGMLLLACQLKAAHVVREHSRAVLKSLDAFIQQFLAKATKFRIAVRIRDGALLDLLPEADVPGLPHCATYRLSDGYRLTPREVDQHEYLSSVVIVATCVVGED